MVLTTLRRNREIERMGAPSDSGLGSILIVVFVAIWISTDEIMMLRPQAISNAIAAFTPVSLAVNFFDTDPFNSGTSYLGNEAEVIASDSLVFNQLIG